MSPSSDEPQSPRSDAVKRTTVGPQESADQAAASSHASSPQSLAGANKLQLAAIISGVLGFLLFIATPLLPVTQTQSSFQWPNNESVNSVNAPLISVAPESLSATVPRSALDELREGETLVLGTVPVDSEESSNRGLFVRAYDGRLDVVALDEVIFDLDEDELRSVADDAMLDIDVQATGTSVSMGEYSQESDDDLRPQVTGVYTELSDEPGVAESLTAAGLNVDVEINSRFTSTPTVAKSLAMGLGVFFMIISLIALARMDLLDGRRDLKVMPERWYKLRPLDGVVVAILGVWHVFGANTSDDGYILTMSRVTEHAGYMANYYRWYGVPESPFGTPYYDLLALFAQVSTSSLWMRLPALVCAIAVWFVLSREILPRLGSAIATRRLAYWTAAFVFLACWLPYNNGTRPEPFVALGAVLTWVSFERAIASQRLLPGAIGTLIATITLAAGPTGLIAVGSFLVALPYLVRILIHRLRLLGVLSTSAATPASEALPPANSMSRSARWRASAAMIAPFLASGTMIMVMVFHSQTLATVIESARVRGEVGPSLEWFMEFVRYATLFEPTVDGSFTRRFALLVMFACLGLILHSFIRHRGVPGATFGPTQRLVIIVGLSMFFLMFTPTKWTHHFGIYAGIAGALGALGAVALSRIALSSKHARSLSLAGVLFILAFSLAGSNAWWYVSSFSIPWWDRTIQLRGIEASAVVLGISLVVLLIGIVQAFRQEYLRAQARDNNELDAFTEKSRRNNNRWAGVVAAPIAVVSAGVVVISLASFAKAFVDQYPAYSVGKGNLAAAAGDHCALANEALIETNTNDSFLTPVGVELGQSLESEDIRGFNPSGIPAYIEPESGQSAAASSRGDTGAAGTAGTTDGTNTNGTTGSTDGTNTDGATGTTDGTTTDGGGENNNEENPTGRGGADDATGPDNTTADGLRDDTGVNGASIRMPFNLDYTKVPVVGSWADESEAQTAAEVTTAWYELPEHTEDAPLLVVSAAGRIAHHDINGISQEGEELLFEYGTRASDGTVTNTEEVEPYDVGAMPTWRNLRYPLDEIPQEANVVRITAKDVSLDPEDWIALTPPRNPQLETVNHRFDDSTPGLLDWSTALQFPCQRPFDHYAGVTEIPEFRVLPDTDAQSELTGFQDYHGGGAMATAEAVNWSYEIPGYLDGDWNRDWGSIYKYELRRNSEGIAPDDAEIIYDSRTRSGWWHPSEMKIEEE